MVWAVFIFWNIPWNLGGPGEEFFGIFSGISGGPERNIWNIPNIPGQRE